LPDVLTEAEVLKIFEQCGALLHGHFRLASGLHSDVYFEKAQVLQYPSHVERLCAEIARRYAREGVQLVIGPTTPGVIVAHETARALSCRSIFAEREGGRRVLRRGFRIEPGECVLVVDDVLTTGGSIRDVLDLVVSTRGEVAGAAVLIDRSGGMDFGVKLEALAKVDAQAYKPEQCPHCRAGLPLVKPGSSPG
jgi:orotate phosphoribosyltransferase